MSSSPTSMDSPGMSLTIRPSTNASLGGLPLRLPSTLSATPAPVPAPQSTPAPAPEVRTSFVLSSSRSCHLRLLSPEAIARHALGSPVVPVRGPPRLAEGWLSFPAPVPSPADDPRVVFANTTPDTHRSQSHLHGSDSASGSKSAYGSGYVAHRNGAGPGPSTAAAWRGADRLSTIQEASTHRSFSPPPAVAAIPLSRQPSIATSDAASVSASVMTRSTSAASDSAGTDISVGTSAASARSSSSRASQRPWVPQRTRGRSVDASLRFADFKSWSVRSEDFGQSRKEARRARGVGLFVCSLRIHRRLTALSAQDGRDASSSTAGSGSTGPRPEPVREREEEDEFGRELDELESVVSDMSEKLATLHFVGREAPEGGDGEGSMEMGKGKGKGRGEVRRERREARRAAEKVPATPSKNVNRPSASRRSSSSAGSDVSGPPVRAGPVLPLVSSAS
ncbi:hypothetical protein PENSPDRAFT_349007 [Peniophora sp. CONT]|nr:hypothetical protein PENSPDRAFT_349007 [Peniophora sp. CONT]